MPFKYRKTVKVIVWLLLSVLFIGIAIQLSIIFYFNARVKSDIQAEFRRQTGNTYMLEMKAFRLNLFTRSVQIRDILIRPQEQSGDDDAKYYISAASLSFENFSLMPFFTSRALDFNRLELSEPSVTIFRNNVDAERDTNENRQVFSTYKLLQEHIHSLKVNRIRIRNARIRIYDDEKDSLLLLDSRDNELDISDLRIDKESDRLGRLFLAARTDLVIKNCSFTTPDSLYTIRVARVRASYTGSRVSMDSVSLSPNYPPKRFALKAREQTDRMDISVEKIEFSHMDVKLFFEKNWFIAQRLDITGFTLDAYRDKNIPRRPVRQPSIQSLIRRIPVYIKVDSIEVKQGTCVYREVPEGSAVAGRIIFHHISGMLTGFTNRPSMIRPDILRLNASCRLMEHGKLRVYYGFPLNADNTVFDCSGLLYGMPFTELNRVLEPIAKVSALEGEIDSMSFRFHANEQKATGKMKLLYHGLKIQILKKKDFKPAQVEYFLSFMAHSLFIKEQNPTGNQPPRVTTIDYVRDPERFIFNYTLKALLSGIKPALGLPDRQRTRKFH